jgi:predicted peptidase
MIGSPRLGLACVGLLLLAVAPVPAENKAQHGFLDRVFKDSDGKESKYVVFVPHDYKGDKAYPLILFLHGAGSKGTDGKKQLAGGLAPAIKKQEKTFPFLVIFPQAQNSWKADSDDARRALAILEEVQKNYKVDGKRIYLTGLSMGGSGTWSLAVAHPDRWAAVVPLCGRADLKQVARIKDLPCWCFVGDKDKAELVENNREMIKALKAAGSAVRYQEYEGVGHNCWDRAYATQELFDWLLMQKLK